MRKISVIIAFLLITLIYTSCTIIRSFEKQEGFSLYNVVNNDEKSEEFLLIFNVFADGQAAWSLLPYQHTENLISEGLSLWAKVTFVEATSKGKFFLSGEVLNSIRNNKAPFDYALPENKDPFLMLAYCFSSNPEKISFDLLPLATTALSSRLNDDRSFLSFQYNPNVLVSFSDNRNKLIELQSFISILVERLKLVDTEAATLALSKLNDSKSVESLCEIISSYIFVSFGMDVVATLEPHKISNALMVTKKSGDIYTFFEFISD